MRRRLYLFPALIPLAELLPWLLSALGAVAGVAGFSFKDFRQTHRAKFTAFVVLCFVAAGGIVVYAMPEPEVRHEGTKLLDSAELPKAVLHRDVKPSPVPPPAEKFGEARRWHVKEQILASPVMAGGWLVTAGYDGGINAYDPVTGDEIWTTDVNEPVLAFTTDDSGIVYAGEGLHTTRVSGLSAIRGKDGKILWQREFLGHVEEPPAVHPDLDIVVTGSGPGSIWALDIDSGRVKWHQDIGHMDSRPLVRDGVVYVHAKSDAENSQGYLFALRLDDGKELWKAPLPGQPWGEPQMHKDGKTILTTTGIGQIGLNKETDEGWAHAVSREDGKILWTQPLADMPLQPAHYIAETDAFVSTLKNGDVVAMAAVDGKVVWTAKIGGDVQSVASLTTHLAKPLLAVTSYDGEFTVIRATDGAVLARRLVPKGSTSSPLIVDDRAYVATPYDVTVFEGMAALAATP